MQAPIGKGLFLKMNSEGNMQLAIAATIATCCICHY